MTKTKHSSQVFSQRIGKLIETHIIKEYNLFTNNRQRTRGYYDGYDSTEMYEIKAAKDDNFFRIRKDNHDLLQKTGHGHYIFVNYELKNEDKGLKLISDIIITNISEIGANELLSKCSKIKEDYRGRHKFYKIKITGEK